VLAGMRRVVGDALEVSIAKLPQFEERKRPGLALGRSTVLYSYFEVTVNGISYVIVKCQQQIEDLAALLRLEVFHVPLPTIPSRSPRGGGSSGLDEYLIALAAIAPSLSESKTFRAFLTSNVAPQASSLTLKFWDAGTA
jgi:hypothetical protein